MIRKLIAGLAVVGILAVGSATVVSAETSSGTTTPSAPSAQQQQQVHDRRCARANRLLTLLEKWQTQVDARITKLQAKQAQLAQTDPDKAAKVADLITRLQKRSSELKEYTAKLASGIGDKCPAPAPAAAPTTTS
jgi:chromosome segregation ATPase